MTRHGKKIKRNSLGRFSAATTVGGLLMLLAVTLGASTSEKASSGARSEEAKKLIIGATAELVEAECGFKFKARVDTGAKSCSLHVEEWEIKDEEKFKSEQKTMTANIGKTIRFRVTNEKGKSEWVEKKIVGYAVYKTSEKMERRYQVMLDLKWQDLEKSVKVNLNDRSHLEFPLLLGRNYLRGDFLVDVDIDNKDKLPKESVRKDEDQAEAEDSEVEDEAETQAEDEDEGEN